MKSSKVKKKYTVYGIFSDISDNDLATLENTIFNAPAFKNGIYGNDKTSWNTSSLFHDISNYQMPGSQYIANVELIGNDFAIDPSKINMTSDEKAAQDEVDSVNKQLETIINQHADDYGYTKRFVTDKQSIVTAVNEINNEIMKSAKTPNINLLTYNSETGKLQWESKIDLYNFIAN